MPEDDEKDKSLPLLISLVTGIYLWNKLGKGRFKFFPAELVITFLLVNNKRRIEKLAKGFVAWFKNEPLESEEDMNVIVG